MVTRQLLCLQESWPCSRKQVVGEKEGLSQLDLSTSTIKSNLSQGAFSCSLSPAYFHLGFLGPNQPPMFPLDAKKAKTAGNRIVTIEWINHIPTPGTGTLPPKTKLESRYRERNEQLLSVSLCCVTYHPQTSQLKTSHLLVYNSMGWQFALGSSGQFFISPKVDSWDCMQSAVTSDVSRMFSLTRLAVGGLLAG